MRKLLTRLTSLTPIALGAAAGLIVVGVLAVAGGGYGHQVVRDQLVPQQIFFAPKGSATAELPKSIEQYGGTQVVNGAEAYVFANDYMAVHLKAIGQGGTYSSVSEAFLKDPKSAALGAERQTLFMGTTLRSMLLNAWGWDKVATLAVTGGILLIVIGSILFLLPALAWLLNLRAAEETVPRTKRVRSATAASI